MGRAEVQQQGEEKASTDYRDYRITQMKSGIRAGREEVVYPFRMKSHHQPGVPPTGGSGFTEPLLSAFFPPLDPLNPLIR
jgi:hypothetical protein